MSGTGNRTESKQQKKEERLIDSLVKSYRGNSHLKTAGEKIELTPEHIKEYKKCMKDPVYFAERYIKIVHIDKGLIPIQLYDYQKKVIRNMHDNRFSIVLSSRQSGKTVSAVCFLLWYVLFNESKRCAVLANKARTAQMIVARIELAYQNLPKWLQQGIVDWNKSSFSLENGSSIMSAASSSDSIRGESFSCLYQDEAAFVQNSVFVDFYRSTFPTISSGKESKYILVSTFNGQNHFYDIWEDAVAGRSLFVPTRIDWWEMPGRDDKWKEDMLKQMSEEDFAQEYGNEPLGTGNTLFNSRCFTILNETQEKPIYSTVETKIYREPVKGHRYIISVDPADVGTDYSVIQVIDVTSFPYEQVAIYRSNKIGHLALPHVILEMGLKYNKAKVVVESNDVGRVVLYILNFDMEYPDIVSTRTGPRMQLGVKTTSKSKAIGCARLKDFVESRKLLIHDKITIDESKHFVIKGNSYQAEEPHHDDCMMSLVIFSYYANLPQFLSEYDHNFSIEMRKEFEKDIEESLCPLPIFADRYNDIDDGFPPGFLD